MQRKRIVNIRPLFVMLLGLILGMLTFYGFLQMRYLKNTSAYFVVGIICFSLSVILLAISLVFIKKKTNLFVSVLCKHRINLILLIVFILIGCFVLGLKTLNIQNLKTYTEEVLIQGVIQDVSEKETYTRLTLSNVTINGKTELDEDLNVNVFTSEYYDKNFTFGTVVQFVGEIEKTSLITSTVNLSSFSNGVIYNSSVSISDIKLVGGDSNIILDLRQSIRDVLSENLNKENSAIATGMLLGQKGEIDLETSDSFSYAGISHILAVSGLHVGFLVGFLVALFKLLRVKLKYSAVFITVILFLYCALCNFTPSVLRASIMAIVLLSSQLLGERYDALSSLSLAGVIILLLFPLDLFNVGFQMSFLCVLSIITLTQPVSNLIRKIKIPKSIADLLAMSVCVNLVLLPVSANAFNYVSLTGIISNLIIIPLFSFTFPLLFVVTFLSLIFSFCSFLFVLPEILIHFIKIIAEFFASMTFSHFKMFNYGYLIVFFIILFMMVVKFLMTNLIIKGTVVGVITVVILSMFIANTLPKYYNEFELHISEKYSSFTSVLTTENNEKILVGYNKYVTDDILTKMKVKQIDAFVAIDFTLTDLNDYIEIANEYNVKNLIIPYESYYTDYALEKLKNVTNVIIVNHDYEICGVAFEFLCDSSKRYGLAVNINDKNMLFLNKLTKNQLLKLNNFNLGDMDYLISNYLKNDLELLNFKVENVFVCEKSEFENNETSILNYENQVVEL